MERVHPAKMKWILKTRTFSFKTSFPLGKTWFWATVAQDKLACKELEHVRRFVHVQELTYTLVKCHINRTWWSPNCKMSDPWLKLLPIPLKWCDQQSQLLMWVFAVAGEGAKHNISQGVSTQCASGPSSSPLEPFHIHLHFWNGSIWEGIVHWGEAPCKT